MSTPANPVRETAASAPAGRLVRAMGTWVLAAGIINVTVGGGIFRLPSGVAAALGTSAPVAYVLCALAMGLIVLCFADAGSRVAMTGGPYAYVEVAFGPFVGFVAGVLLWAVGTFAFAAVATVFADSLGALVPALGDQTVRMAVLVAVLALLAAVNVRGVRQGAGLNTVMTVAKLLPLLLLVAAGAFAVDASNLAIGQVRQADEVARASVLLIFAFAGLESALVPSGEVRDVARTVPRAILTAMAGITVLYVAIHLVCQGVLGEALATSQTPLADAAGRVLGPWGRTLLLVGAVVSMFGYVSGMTLAVPRALFALARDGFLPRRLAAVHPRFQTPHVAIAVQAVVVSLLAVTSGFEPLAILANVSTLLVYAACCLAAWQLRRKGVREGGIPFRVPAAGVIPFVALAVIAFLLSQVTLREWAVVVGVVVAAAALYFITAPARARAAAAVADAADVTDAVTATPSVKGY